MQKVRYRLSFNSLHIKFQILFQERYALRIYNKSGLHTLTPRKLLRGATTASRQIQELNLYTLNLAS